MEAVGLSSAHHAGWSDGAVIGLLVALRRPDLVKKLVFIGQHINPDGIAPWVRQMSENMSPEMLPPMLREAYDAVSPDGPEHFSVVFEKLAQLYRTEPNLPMSELRAVKAPTLVKLGTTTSRPSSTPPGYIRRCPNPSWRSYRGLRTLCRGKSPRSLAD